jgi:hypothetical protein
MLTTPAIRRRRHRAEISIGMPGDNRHIINVARRLRPLVDAPVLGGIAVYLHGGGRSTVDLDFYTIDRKTTAAQLEAAGARWDKTRHEHVLDGVRIHTVAPEDAGVLISRASIIDGVRVVGLKDLIAIKLLCGLNQPARSKDIGDVEDLIRSIPLDKQFAGKLPKAVRSEFKVLVDAVRAAERQGPDNRRF